MDTANSQKRSPRSSAKSKRSSVEPGSDKQRPSFADSNPDEFEERYDHSFDMVERVRRARAAAERKMNAFSGNLEDYVLVRKIVGQKSVRERQAASTLAPSQAEGDRQARLKFAESVPDGKQPSE